MQTTDDVTIREFIAGDEEAFYRLNEEWIVRLFAMEPRDEEIIRNPRRIILDRGGRIFFAIRNGEPIGCCALLPTEAGEYELSKMAVTESCRGAGLGRRILERVIAEARASGATRLYLETNHQLEPAIHLYESVGFRHIPPERKAASPYARSDVSMELYFTSAHRETSAG